MAERAASPTEEDLEAVIFDRGQRLLERVEPERLITLTPAWWQERLLEWAAETPDFRVRLLRFVDVMPTLRTTRAIADHVRQYFQEDVPGAIRLGSQIGGRAPFRPILSRIARTGVHSMAERFIAGASIEEAMPRLRQLVESGVAYTVDLLGEATLSDAEAEVYRDRYLAVVERLAESWTWQAADAVREPNVSIKLSALSARFKPEAPESVIADLEPRLLPILRRAREKRVLVNVDMEQFRYRDLIHRIVEHVLLQPEFRDWDDVGVVVQAYLRDAAEDVERMRSVAERRGSPITIRLVKGAYWDEERIVAHQEGHPVPVFEDKAATDASYERCTEQLVNAYPHLRPAFASHNPRSLAQALTRIDRAGLPGEFVEFQMLYGMAEGLRRSVREEGFTTRVYVPVGEIVPGMAYLVRRLLENSSNQSWLLQRHSDIPASEALARPIPRPTIAPTPPAFMNHPHAEFHLPRDRQAMAAAIERRRQAGPRECPLLIGNDEVHTRAVLAATAPAHPELTLGRVAQAGADEIERAVACAREAMSAWRDAGGRARAAILRKAADLVAERRFDLAAIEVFESAKPWTEADGDITEAIDFLRYYALQAEEIAEPRDLSPVPGETNHLLYEPRGVAAVIAPWNFPLAIITGMTAGALAAGCPAILKPAEQSPVIAAHLVEILREAGVPAGAVQYLPGPGEVVGEALVAHPHVAMIAFTGSNAVGKRILSVAAEVTEGQPMLKRVIAELGGKNALVIDDDADLDQAVAGTITSAFGYAGQKCSACSRVIVVGSAYDEFRARLAAAVESLAAGYPEDPATTMPPVISVEAREGIEGYIALGMTEGKLVAKGPAFDAPTYVVPHVFEALPPGSRLLREEIFGPVLALLRARAFSEGIEMAMDSDFALTGGVYSRNPRNIALARNRFRVGNLYINRPITGSMVGRQPFAGFKMSGTGEKAGGPDYVRQFTVPRVMTENTVRRGFAPED